MSCIFNDTLLGGVKLIIPKVYYDSRGYFLEAMNVETLARMEIDAAIVQENQAFSYKGVLRGLHFQKPPFAQGKLVRALQGEILDLAFSTSPPCAISLRFHFPQHSPHHCSRIFF